MFDTIFIGTSGLLNHSKGLRVVGNNLANVNTPGFKSAQLQFANLFEQGGGGQQQGAAGGGGGAGVGGGLTSLGSRISFRAGLDQATGNPLDLNINGNGFYAIKRDDQILYTRAGDFRFNNDGVLVNASGDKVMGLEAGGKLAEISLAKLGHNQPKATSTVKFSGNLSSAPAVPPVDATVNNVTVLGPNGADYPVNLSFKDNGNGDYTVTITDKAGATVKTESLKFAGGFPTAATSTLSFTYNPAGTAFTVKLDFSQGVTSLATANTISYISQDGYAAGVKTDQTIGSDGVVTVHYSNGQNTKGPRLALANFVSEEDLEQGAGSTFSKKAGALVEYGHAGAGDFGSLAAGHREGSNVDLAEEFGNLILMQRGYQASSHVISTANDMIQQLFDMKR